MSWLDGTRARLCLLFARRAAESRMDEEIRFHLDMETERLAREQGLEPEEARRQALVTFGGVTRHKEALRDGRGITWLSGLSLDFRLGVRMFVKYPGLTLVGVLGMATGVAIAAVGFTAIATIVDSALPLDEGERVVTIRNVDARAGDEGSRTHLQDLATWRQALTTVEDLGAYRILGRNLITRDGRAESIRVAEMTASGFRLARTPALLGRYVGDEDERPGAPPVAVIGFDVWQDRFAGRSDVVGQTLELGATRHTVIGVMPRGFAFPINNRVWTPLRLDASRYEAGQAPPLEVFGRLAPAATLEDAQRQLATIGQRLALTYPQTHRFIRPRLLPYTRSYIDDPELAWAFHGAQVLVSLVLVVIGTNVGILVYARTATRAGEIAVRIALGASRGRVVTQLFAEALVLSVVAAAAGIAGAALALREGRAFLMRMGGEQLPFWMRFDITPVVILYVVGLAVLGAVIVGVVPALRATRPRVHDSLQQLGSGGSAMRLGRTWTFLIVAQIAVAVAILPLAIAGVGQWVRLVSGDATFARKQMLTATLVLDRQDRQDPPLEAPRSAARKLSTLGAPRAGRDESDAEIARRFANLRAELARRLEAEPGVAGVAMSTALPGIEPHERFEIDAPASARGSSAAPHAGFTTSLVGVSRVDPEYFDTFDVPILTGRGFRAGDASPGATAVIVNRSFVRKLLGGANPLGVRVRRAAAVGRERADTMPAEPWAEIVGVVPDFPTAADSAKPEPRLYRPLLATGVPAVVLDVRVKGAAPASISGRLRELTVAVDPMLRIGRIETLDDVLYDVTVLDRALVLTMALVTLSAVLLSIAGIYALMSLTVTRRRREIGIRSALGAGSRQVLTSVLSRAFGQVAVGIVVGIALAGVLDRAMEGGWTAGQAAVILPAVAVLMTAVGLLAAAAPARRALRIQPTEALRAE